MSQLIRELKKMPAGMEVGVAMHDNSEDEVAGWVQGVKVIVDHEFGNNPEGSECVVLRC